MFTIQEGRKKVQVDEENSVEREKRHIMGRDSVKALYGNFEEKNHVLYVCSAS